MNVQEWVDLDVLKPCHTGGLTSIFAPGVGKLTVFNTWLVLSSPLCPGGGGLWLQMTEALLSLILYNWLLLMSTLIELVV